MIASLSFNTIKQYNTTYSKWWLFCSENDTDMFQPSVENILSFLKTEFNLGAKYSTLNTHRSALNLICNVGKSETIERFMKGVFKLRPTFPKYKETWDPEPVLKFLGSLHPLNTLSLEKLTMKTILLLSLCSAQRAQTFSKIKLSNIKQLGEGIEIVFSDILKTSGPKKYQPQLQFPYFLENPELCIASAILHYIDMTRTIRGNEDILFLTIKKPHKAATTQTLSRWIKKGLKLSGINTQEFKGHSTRHAAASAALRVGTHIDTIREAAGWSDKSKTFNRFYNKPLINKNVFANYIKKIVNRV